ncbi:MAG: UDP binding domain-containing protein, partial [Candidatus Levyibacteriota bacterium]
GYGGSCFPKDVRALITIAKDYDYDFGLLTETEQVNSQAKRDIVRKVRKALGELKGKSVGVLGLAFKANTDDMRDAPAIDIIELLKKDGVKIKAYDPEAAENAKRLMPDVEYVTSAYEAITGADAMLVVTEWNEFKEIDLKKVKKALKSPLIIDARNLYDPEKAKEMGFTYIGVGR